jgi:hypothetical protein
MNSLSNIFDEIKKDFSKDEYKNQRVLSRRFIFDNDIVFIAYFNNHLETKEIAIRIPNNYCKSVVSKYPNWKGIDLSISEIDYGADEGIYISFQQLTDYDDNIYDAILEDLLETLENISDDRQSINTIGKVLVKWKQFFVMHNELIMSEIRQQGLYGELLFLEKMINNYGNKALGFWSGCNSETHDFYISGDAIEVKTTSTNSANRVTISNEYQLDNNDVAGKLYLMFVALRKSQSDGETIPILVERIIEKLTTNEALDIFEDKLFKYGYLLKHPEIYRIGFSKRETRYFQVQDKFPKLTKSVLPVGITNVDYILNLDGCDRFIVLEEKLIEGLKE